MVVIEFVKTGNAQFLSQERQGPGQALCGGGLFLVVYWLRASRGHGTWPALHCRDP